MVTIECFSQMVSAVHAASVEPDRWVEAMTLVRIALGGNATGLVVDQGANRAIQSCSFTDDEAITSYANYYRQFDYVLKAVESSAPGLVHSGEALVALNPRSAFNAEWMRRYELNDGMFVRLTAAPRPCSFVVAGRHAGPFATPDNVRVLNALVPQLQRALRTQHAVAELRDRVASGNHPADSFSAPAMTVFRDMTIGHTNAAAESLLRCSADILVRSGHVLLSFPSADAELRRAVSQATRESGPRTAETLTVPRDALSRPLVVHVLPSTNLHRQQAVVIVVDPDNHREPPKKLLRQLFSLTDAEAEVTLRIARGQALAAVADELILSLATVKTHLQHVYQKTDTHRQGELVRLLLSLMP